MSSKIIFSAGAMLLLFSYSNCTKLEPSSSITPSVGIAQDRTTPLEFAATAGTSHNAGLENIRLTFDFSQSFASNTARADSLLSNLCNFFDATQALNFATGYQSFARDSMAAAINQNIYGSTAKILTRLASIRNASVVTNNLSTSELNFLDSLTVFFSTNISGLTKSQVCVLTYNKSTSLLTAFNQITWGSGQGTLACGALHTLKSTSLYWASRNPSGFIGFTGDPNDVLTGGQAWIILQADCIGYIVGWASALIDDSNHGGVTPEGQDRRIQQGFNSAAGYSASVSFF